MVTWYRRLWITQESNEAKGSQGLGIVDVWNPNFKRYFANNIWHNEGLAKDSFGKNFAIFFNKRNVVFLEIQDCAKFHLCWPLSWTNGWKSCSVFTAQRQSFLACRTGERNVSVPVQLWLQQQLCRNYFKRECYGQGFRSRRLLRRLVTVFSPGAGSRSRGQ